MSVGNEPEASDSLKSYGAMLKAFRERAGLTQEDMAPLVRYSPQTVASIEQGRRLPPQDFVDRAEDCLDGFGALKAGARHLTRRPGLAAWFRQWAGLEEQALSLCTYECRVVPGLLQTEAYARAVREATANAVGAALTAFTRHGPYLRYTNLAVLGTPSSSSRNSM